MQEHQINEPMQEKPVDQNTKETMDSATAGTDTISADQDETEGLKAEINELKDKYLRLVADFDNFRKRTAKERLEMMQTAGKEVISSLLEVLDDCDRAEKQAQNGKDNLPALSEGISLIFTKLRNILQARGLKSMESIGTDFDPDKHEAISEIPVPDNMKGKVIDELEKGYYINDRIIRFAKVIVGK